MLRFATVLSSLALLGFSGLSETAPRNAFQAAAKTDRPATVDLHSIMKKKLANAQKVLEAIALEDFNKIQSGGEELIALSKETEWRALRTPEYELQTDSFRRAAQDLVKAAGKKNVDGAALAYVELTMTCVRCHKYVRDTRRTQVSPQRNEVISVRAR